MWSSISQSHRRDSTAVIVQGGGHGTEVHGILRDHRGEAPGLLRARGGAPGCRSVVLLLSCEGLGAREASVKGRRRGGEGRGE